MPKTKKKSKKWYVYKQYWSECQGNTIDRPASKKDINNLKDYSISRDNPTTRKLKKEFYETGMIGIGEKTHGDYLDTIEWGKMGGRPKKWINESQRKKTRRIQEKFKTGLKLTTAERNLLGLIKCRPGAYKYHTNQPASSTERKRKERAKNKLALGKPLKDEEKKLLGIVL